MCKCTNIRTSLRTISQHVLRKQKQRELLAKALVYQKREFWFDLSMVACQPLLTPHQFHSSSAVHESHVARLVCPVRNWFKRHRQVLKKLFLAFPHIFRRFPRTSRRFPRISCQFPRIYCGWPNWWEFGTNPSIATIGGNFLALFGVVAHPCTMSWKPTCPTPVLEGSSCRDSPRTHLLMSRMKNLSTGRSSVSWASKADLRRTSGNPTPHSSSSASHTSL